MEDFKLLAARDVLYYSFIVQKSLEYLDLSACKSSLRTKPVFTDEGFRKEYEPNREILYRLHLDVSVIRRRRRANRPEYVFQPVPLSVSDSVYNRDLPPLIVNTIRNAENKGEKLRRHLNIMRLLKLHETYSTAIYLFNNIIQILHPDCTDSEVIAEFAFTFLFAKWIIHHDNPELVGYVLGHIRRMGRHLWQTHEREMNLINICLLTGRAGNVFKLLQYGSLLNFHFPYRLLINIPGNNFRNRYFMSRRLFLLLQYVWIFTSNRNLMQALRYIWRSIPDPYLNYMEMYSTFENLAFIKLEDMFDCYKKAIMEEGESEHVPRRLEHLCRVSIRSSLHRTYQLPDGIRQLGVPSKIQAYLNLQF